MAIQKIKANKTASLTDLREPMKVIEAAGDEAVAIMNRNQLLGYFVPASQTEVSFRYVTDEEFAELSQKMLKKAQPVLDYLKDK